MKHEQRGHELSRRADWLRRLCEVDSVLEDARERQERHVFLGRKAKG